MRWPGYREAIYTHNHYRNTHSDTHRSQRVMSFNPPLRPGNLIKGFKADGRESSAPSRLSEEDEAHTLLLRGIQPHMTH